MKILSLLKKILFKEVVDKEKLSFLPHAPLHHERWIFSRYDYQNKDVRKMIRYLKNHEDRELIKVLAQELSEVILDYLAEQQELSYFVEPIVIPTPLSKRRLHERGFNQVALLAKKIARQVGGEYRSDILIRTLHTEKQALIRERKKRFENVRGVYMVKNGKEKELRGRDIILVDDLSTTGATLLELRKMVRKAGARKVIAVTIAH